MYITWYLNTEIMPYYIGEDCIHQMLAWEEAR